MENNHTHIHKNQSKSTPKTIQRTKQSTKASPNQEHSSSRIMQLQKSAGNRAVAQLMKSRTPTANSSVIMRKIVDITYDESQTGPNCGLFTILRAFNTLDSSRTVDEYKTDIETAAQLHGTLLGEVFDIVKMQSIVQAVDPGFDAAIHTFTNADELATILNTIEEDGKDNVILYPLSLGELPKEVLSEVYKDDEDLLIDAGPSLTPHWIGLGRGGAVDKLNMNKDSATSVADPNSKKPVSNTATVEELANANLALKGESLAWEDFDSTFGAPSFVDMKGADNDTYKDNYNKAVDEKRVDELKLGGKLIAVTKR